MAIAVEELIERHPNVLDYTPRQIIAWFNLAQRRKRRRNLELLAISRVAAHGDNKAVKALHKAWED